MEFQLFKEKKEDLNERINFQKTSFFYFFSLFPKRVLLKQKKKKEIIER